jgi:probable rRNA maturation factor
MREGSFRHLHRELLGDVVISTQRAIAQAGKFHTTIEEEVCLYIVHGILHLLGYDDIAPANRRRMERKQDKTMQQAATYFGKDFFVRAVSVNHKTQAAC